MNMAHRAQYRKEKRIWHLTLLLALLLSLSGVTSAQPVEIEFMTNGNDSAEWLAMIDLFHQSQDEVRVKLVEKATAGLYLDALTVQVAAGNPPDVALVVNRMADLIRMNLARPVTGFFEASGLAESFVPAAIHLVTLEGEMYSLPRAVLPGVVHYSPQLFRESGLADANELHAEGRWDWETFKEYATKLSRDEDGDGAYEIWGSAGAIDQLNRLIPWLHQSGQGLFDTDFFPTESRFATPEIQGALVFLRSLVESGAMPLEAIKEPFSDFVAGRVGIFPDGAWRIANLLKGEPPSWDMAPALRGPASATPSMVIEDLFMLSTTKHPEAAWKWMEFVATDPGALRVYPRPPAYTPALWEWAVDTPIGGQPEHIDVVIRALMEFPEAPPLVPFAPNFNQMRDDAKPELRAYFEGKQSVVNTVERIDHILSIHLAEGF